LSATVGQIQGVWVHPQRRGRRLAAGATAAVVQRLHRMGRVASLYVNAYNTPALATYRRVGFTQVGCFATVLF
jgi:predicted GNAT family acetyltransferase